MRGAQVWVQLVLACATLSSSHKTGTLTQNVMILKRFNVGSGAYTIENRGQISKLLKPEYAKPTLAQYESQKSLASSALPFDRKRKIVETTEALRVAEAIKAFPCRR
ncbi:unnamed protein product [Rotaria magnacalcarata]|uniref:Uncharacterized protein n=1 Tax=Rotaria magnacalcarata TaxID=392030 RepID=A0A816SCN8_9BILA|nr:unnamed protein product [Rotaria magnacalcarata]CAF4438604.1 unnamed protein product [Rotaria magnacalcarata]